MRAFLDYLLTTNASVKSILITGATGFLGSAVLKDLVQLNYDVTILKRSFSNLERITEVVGKITIYDIDVVSIESVFLKKNYSILIHAACHYGRNEDTSFEIYQTNLIFGMQLLELAVKYQVKAFINCDTFYKKYLNYYSLSKKQFLEYLYFNSQRIKIINFRIMHMYGPNDDDHKFFRWIFNQFANNKKSIELTRGEQLRDFIYIDDVVSAFNLVVCKSIFLPSYNNFDVGSGKLVSIYTMLNVFRETYRKFDNNLTTSLHFGSMSYNSNEMMSVICNNSKLIELGWKPKYSLEEGLKEVIRHEYSALRK